MKYNTLELILHWGKLQPSNQKLRVRSLVTDKVYDMTLNGFLYWLDEKEVGSQWQIE